MKKVGILYDNISGNTGDVAIGLSVKKILRDINVDFEELIPGNFNPNDYETIIIGGGHLLRPSPDFFYDKFKILGNHILNAAGIVDFPADLHYLNDYKYVSVRSSGDKEKISYIQKDVHVVPCTTMLLEDIKDFPLEPKKPNIGIHLSTNFFNKDDEELFIKWASNLPYSIYFIPITHYNQDYIYLEKLSLQIKNSVLLPILKPLEIFTFIGRLDYFISCSLHGAIFSYIHNIPFLLVDVEKMRFFMEDRKLQQYLFKNFQDIKKLFENLSNEPPDYSQKISTDLKILQEYVNKLKSILTINQSFPAADSAQKDNQVNFQIYFLQSQIISLHSQIKNIENSLQEKSIQVTDLTSALQNRDSRIKALETGLQEKNTQVTERTSALQVKDTQIKALETGLQEKSMQVTELRSALQVKDTQIKALETGLQEKSMQVTERTSALQKKSTQVIEVTSSLQDREAQIKTLETSVLEKSAHNNELTNALQVKNARIRELELSLQNIYQGIAWRIIMKYHRGVERLLPSGTRRRRYYDLAFTGIRIIANDGWKSFLIKFKEKMGFLVKNSHGGKPDVKISECFDAKKEDIQKSDDVILSFGYQPKISIIMPVYNTELRWLTKAIDSVRNQIYDNWELCIVNDASTREHIEGTLDDYATRDRRIKVKHSEKNKGISGASNESLSFATGEFVAFLDHDDELTQDALYEIVKLLNEHLDADIIYSDDDKIDDKGNRYDLQFKPDWSPELLLSYCYFSHIKVLRRTLLEETGNFREEYDGSQDYDLVLRVVEKTDKIYHIPKILYHWRSVPSSTAYSAGEKPKSIEAGRKAVEDAVKRRGISGKVVVPEFAQKNKNGVYKINFELKSKPKISIIIPTKDKLDLLNRCIKSIEDKTTYNNYEIVVVDTGSIEKETITYLNETKHKVLHIQLDNFNFSRINNYAVSKVDSGFLLFLNNDTEVISENWLEEMVGYMLMDPKIGAVGAKLIYKDGRIQHGGVLLGLHNGLAGHANKLIHYTDGGYLYYPLVSRNYSAVTAACLLTRKKYYEEVGGLDEENFSVAYNDVDFCLKLIQKGYRIVFNPYALLYHDEGGSRGTGVGNDNPAEEEFFKKKWRYLIEKGDPYYNPNLSLEDEKFKIKKNAIEKSTHFFDNKKLLFISHNLNLEGAPYSQFYLAKGLKNRGYKITVISPADGLLKNYYLNIGVEVNILKTPLDNERKRNSFAAWVKSGGFGLSYVNTILNYQFVDLISAVGIPVIWSIRESERELYFSTFTGVGANYFKSARQVVFASNATRKIYSDIEYNGNFCTIYNGIDLSEIEAFKRANTKLDLRKRYGFPDNSKIVTIVGTTCERKGQKVFAEAALKLLNELNNIEIHFFIVGAREGDYLEQLRKMINKNNSTKIHLIPETEAVFDYYFISDIFVCASFIESLPRVILEAMAFELPIIATDVYGIPEEIEDGRSGILIEPGNSNLLAEKIKFLIKNEKISSDYGKNAYARVKSEFSLDRMVDGYQKLIEKSLDNSEFNVVSSETGVRLKKKILKNILACPECARDQLKFEKEQIICKNCNTHYPIKQEVPVFLTKPCEYIDRTNQKDRTNPYSGASLELIEKNKSGLVLDLGSGYPTDNELFENVVYQEIVHYPSTDVVSNTKNLPFKNETFDAIICESVFEHIKDPFHMAEEMFRICKRGGRIRVDTAFLQPYHADPNHYYNMTVSGLENVFHMFKKVRSGVDNHQKASFTLKIFLNKYLELINDQETKVIINELLARPLDKFDSVINNEGHKILGAGVFFEGIKE